MRGCHSLPLQPKDWKRSNHLIRRRLYWFHELEFSVVICSLNREKRQRELLRVTKENQEVLKRILNRKPEYHRSKWQKDWEHNLKFMDNISAYPPNWWQQRKEGSAGESQRDSPREQQSRGSAVKSQHSNRSETQEQQQAEDREEASPQQAWKWGIKTTAKRSSSNWYTYVVFSMRSTRYTTASFNYWTIYLSQMMKQIEEIL